MAASALSPVSALRSGSGRSEGLGAACVASLVHASMRALLSEAILAGCACIVSPPPCCVFASEGPGAVLTAQSLSICHLAVCLRLEPSSQHSHCQSATLQCVCVWGLGPSSGSRVGMPPEACPGCHRQVRSPETRPHRPSCLCSVFYIGRFCVGMYAYVCKRGCLAGGACVVRGCAGVCVKLSAQRDWHA